MISDPPSHAIDPVYLRMQYLMGPEVIRKLREHETFADVDLEVKYDPETNDVRAYYETWWQEMPGTPYVYSETFMLQQKGVEYVDTLLLWHDIMVRREQGDADAVLSIEDEEAYEVEMHKIRESVTHLPEMCAETFPEIFPRDSQPQRNWRVLVQLRCMTMQLSADPDDTSAKQFIQVRISVGWSRLEGDAPVQHPPSDPVPA